MKSRYGKTPQSIARIARTVGNLAISRAFLQAVLLLVITRQGMVIDRHDKYCPRINRLEMSRFAGLSPPCWLWRSVRSVFWTAFLMAFYHSLCILLPEQQ
jgi:hypothetical protein